MSENNKNLKFERFKYGEIPVPRDGHTAFMFKGKMFIFAAEKRTKNVCPAAWNRRIDKERVW